MTTTTKDTVSKKVLVHTYSSSQQKYLVSYADEEDAAAVAAIVHASFAQVLTDDDSESDDDDFFEAAESFEEEDDKSLPQRKPKELVVLLPYTVDQLNPSKGAKFYPFLWELMKRGDQTAAQVGGLWEQNKDKILQVSTQLQEVGSQVGDVVTAKTQALLGDEAALQAQLQEQATKAEGLAATAVESLKDQVKETTPQAQEQVQKVVTMLKDEELTVLLQNGKERLEQLVQSDIPQTTHKTLQELGIKWNEVAALQHNPQLEETQQKALDAVDELLQIVQQAAQAQGMELPHTKDGKLISLKGIDVKELETTLHDLQLDQKFQTMFDNFVEASKSDRTLNQIMEHVTQHTTEWQQMTGRILATKSGSLFMEGASRIQARAGLILSGGNFQAKNNFDLEQWSKSMTTKFTKAFTEGDAAVARLKSIELGDAVRHRLVAAIEIRSESLGGLDGIIAGALGVVEDQTHKTARAVQKNIMAPGHQISNLLQQLQSSATEKGHEARETLISVLSRKSLYRDLALLRLERTFCDLEEQFFGATWNSDDGWSAEDLALLARGQGGTAKLFEPIAKRAKQEIDKQLDYAEETVLQQQEARGLDKDDPNTAMVLEALRRVRKIMSGELTINAIVDDVVNLLNDDKVVAAGEELVQRGERVLDALEGATNDFSNTDINDPTNKLITDAMRVAQKAGITKDSVMKELEKIDVDEMLDTAQGAVTDEKKRLLLLSQATDAALDFFLKILPSMPVPPFEGVKDGLVYHLSNLSMEGFKVKKENIMVEIAGMRATTESKGTAAAGAGASMAAMKEATENMAPQATAGTALSAPDSASSLVDGEHSENNNDDDSFVSQSETVLDICTTDNIGHVKATELLIIDIRDIAAVLDGATWSFEQTYFPYLKGNGKSDVRLADGSLRLQFELRKRKRKIKVAKVGPIKEGEIPDDETAEKEIWEPVLCLHDRSCKIGEVFVSLQGEGRLAWLLNKLADFFKGPLGTYVSRQIVAVMTNKSGWILEKLNAVLSPYWELILQTAGLKMVSSCLGHCQFRCVYFEDDIVPPIILNV
jgi:hypothetical protein